MDISNKKEVQIIVQKTLPAVKIPFSLLIPRHNADTSTYVLFTNVYGLLYGRGCSSSRITTNERYAIKKNITKLVA